MVEEKWIDIEPGAVREKFLELLDNGTFRLLSTITGYQEAENIFIVYHVISSNGLLNFRTVLPMNNLKMFSVSHILPGATLYEREIQDLLGVKFEGILDSRRLILPEQWPDGVYPLRKDYKAQKEGGSNG